jgi:hypothetical protein
MIAIFLKIFLNHKIFLFSAQKLKLNMQRCHLPFYLTPFHRESNEDEKKGREVSLFKCFFVAIEAIRQKDDCF